MFNRNFSKKTIQLVYTKSVKSIQKTATKFHRNFIKNSVQLVHTKSVPSIQKIASKSIQFA